MKLKEIFWKLLSVYVWIYAAGKAIWFFYFPDSRANTFYSYITSYSWVIELIFALLLFFITYNYIHLRKSYKEKNKKISLEVILLFSASGPLLAWANNYCTGNLTLSLFFLSYGIVFLLIAYKLK